MNESPCNHTRDELPEDWTSTELMLQGLVEKAVNCGTGRLAAYQWALGAAVGLLLFVLGVQCQGERLTTKVIRTEVRVEVVERDIAELKDGVGWLKDNIATKTDMALLVSKPHGEP